ncbi:MAG TPA: hypothetical protein VK158_01295 [Acidobacteriota bacterium]|nr:hypothetical protein [Acidobacteriota bacterium]
MEIKSWKKSRNWAGGRGLRLNARQESLLIFVRLMETHHEHELLTLKEIIEILPSSLKMPDSTLSYNFSKLKAYGLVESNVRGEYLLTTKGKKVMADVLKNVSIVGKRLRPHKIQITFTSFYPPQNLDSVRNLCVPISNSKYHGLKFTIKDTTICYYGKTKIVALVEGYHSESIAEVYELAQIQYVEPLIKYLEDFFQIKIDKEKTRVHVNHVALLGTRMAKLAQEANFRYVSDLIHLDASNGDAEAELVGKNAMENLESFIHRIEKWERELKEEKNDNSATFQKKDWHDSAQNQERNE